MASSGHARRRLGGVVGAGEDGEEGEEGEGRRRSRNMVVVVVMCDGMCVCC
jgi:hypothetical protein